MSAFLLLGLADGAGHGQTATTPEHPAQGVEPAVCRSGDETGCEERGGSDGRFCSFGRRETCRDAYGV